eukprot:m.277652 g.277652  ORF g.277652 m.277652 type:complete len:178 (+) comp19784_c0_seq3:330-863(+)
MAIPFNCPECGAAWDDDTSEFCMDCGHEMSQEERDQAAACANGGGKYENYVVGIVESVEDVPKKAKLKVVEVMIEKDNPDLNVTIVTNAKHVNKGIRVVVALPGAIVPAGSNPDEDDNAVIVKKTSVGGKASSGMLCDSPMLGWVGGAAGVAVKLDDTFAVGGPPPAARPAGLSKTD